MKILAIETSCDETAIAMLDFFGPRQSASVRILSHLASSQIKLHAKFGGVVPALAKREHQRLLMPLLLKALKKSGIWHLESGKKMPNAKFKILNSILEREPDLLARFKKKISLLPAPPIDAIAITNGPGLAPALWVGVNFSKALAVLWDKPLIPINHMAGHLYSSLFEPVQKNAKHEIQNAQKIKNSKYQMQSHLAWRVLDLAFPALALLVSGGHTELVLVRGYGKYEIIGETLDDAAGEAFDKVGRMLGFAYPGGPEIARLAARGNADAYALPRPMMESKNYAFSFSGLKTAVLYLIRDLTAKAKLSRAIKADIAASFQKAAIEVLVKKTVRAAKEYQAKTVLLGGGVSASNALRTALGAALIKEISTSEFRYPIFDLCGDNAIMVALAAYLSGAKKAWHQVHAEANARLS